MAEFDELEKRLARRLSKVQGMDVEDVKIFLENSFMEHGYRFDQNVPTDRELLVILYAEWDAALHVSLNAASYFEYKDGEESVDKRAVSEQYRRIAAELKKRYEAKKAEGYDGSTMFSIMTRADRD